MNAKILTSTAALFASTNAVQLNASAFAGLGQFFLPGVDYYAIGTLDEFKAGLEAELAQVGEIDEEVDQAINDEMENI